MCGASGVKHQSKEKEFKETITCTVYAKWEPWRSLILQDKYYKLLTGPLEDLKDQ